MKIPRPVLRYHGGKWRLASWIISHFRDHRCYVEPFGGAASVLLKKPRSFAEIYNDLDDDIVNIFRILQDPALAGALRRNCELTPFARSEFLLAYQETRDPLERARRMLVRSWMGHGASGVRRHRTGFRVNPHRQRTTAAGDWMGWPRAIDVFTERLRGVIIECRPAAQIIAQHDRPDTLFYIDPPYMFDLRSQKRKGNDLYHGYNHEMTDAQHVALLEQVAQLNGLALVSGYPCELYDRLLAGWTKVEKHAQADRGGARVEVMWINPAAAGAIAAGRTPLRLEAAE
jgi:DNA adenine methylase